MTVWGGLVAAFGTVGMVMAGLFAARATKQASAATAEATHAAARAQAEPNQRRADLEAFQEIRTGLERRLERVEERERSLRGLLRSFAGYVTDLTSQMRANGLEPPAPPDRIDEYNRTGV